MISLKINPIRLQPDIAVIFPFVLFYGTLLLVAHYAPTTPARNETPSSVGAASMMQSKDISLNRLRTLQLKNSYKRYQKYQGFYQQALQKNDTASLAKWSHAIQEMGSNYNLIAEETNNTVFVKTGLPHTLSLTNAAVEVAQ